MPRAIRVHRTGGPEVLEFDTLDARAPGPGEALIEQRAIGVNYIDTYHRSGLYPLPALPSGIGVEAAGVVRAVGPDVNDVSVGQRVAYALGPPGAYADERIVSASRLVPLPAQIDEETAAAVLMKGMTVAALILRVYRVEAGENVLLHAAAGGVGLLACQWLHELGARVIASVGSDEKAELVRAHGASDVIVHSREDFVARTRELTAGKGVSVVYDSVGKTTFRGSLDCLARRGTLVVFGNASGKPEPLDVQLLSTKGSLFLTRPTLGDYVTSESELRASAGLVFEQVLRGKLRVRVGQRFALAEARRAHEVLESRATQGSTLLLP